MTDLDLTYLYQVIARKHLFDFAQYVMPSFQATPFHERYYNVLQLFAEGIIKRLIVTVPPQHGKSLGSSQLLPAYMLGLNPDNKIAIASYSFDLARQFNGRIQHVMLSKEYTQVFPMSRLKKNSLSPTAPNFTQTAKGFDVVDKEGGMHSVGRGSGLTGNRVDVMIMDDLYKDAMEGNSPTIREATWEWYTSVVKTRLHNDSQELIVFTRWHEEDLIGMLESKEQVIELKSMDQIDPNFKGWYKINFEAIKESEATELDPRQIGEPLWKDRHDVELLESKRTLDPLRFDCMYQGKPASAAGYLYGNRFKTYSQPPSDIIKKANYTDTADQGDDYLCSVCYDVGSSGNIYITDIVFTPEPMEVTEGMVGEMLKQNITRIAYVESNNGGRGFARSVGKIASRTRMEWFHQSQNKEARILTNAPTVVNNIYLPEDWKNRWPEFYVNLTTYRRNFKANKWHDAADVLTGIVEKEILEPVSKKIRAFKTLK